MEREDTEGDRLAARDVIEPGADHKRLRYDRVRDKLIELGGFHARSFAPTDPPGHGEFELEMWICGGIVYIVQCWLKDGGVDVYKPVSDSIKMDDLLAAIK